MDTLLRYIKGGIKMTEVQNVVFNYKDTVFRMLFRDRGNLLELYNALNGTSYDNPAELTVTTLENAVYMSLKNDISFLFQSYMTLYEHQSTFNPNMPLRDLIYVSKQYEKYIVDRSIYSSTPVSIPAPRFVIFYNGSDRKPEEQVLRLSDLYEVKMEEPELELKVRMLNINPGYNGKIMKTCRTLDEYCQYVARVRRYTEDMATEEAVEKAVTECIKEGILADFLKSQRAEVVAMSILEYDEEVELQKLRAAEYENGKMEGEKIGEERGKRIGEKAGEKRGKQKGQMMLLINQVCKKIKKKQTVSQIAEALEKPEEEIERLCKAAGKYAPEYDIEAICAELTGRMGE